MWKKFITPSGILALCTAFAVVWLAIYVPRVLDNQLTSLRNDVKIESSNTRKEILGTVNENFTKLFGFANQSVQITNNRIGSIQKDLFASIDNIKTESLARVDNLNNTANNQLTETNKSIAKLSDAYSKIPEVVGARFDKQTNCDMNGLCWQNMITDTMVQTRYAARDFGLASQTFQTQFPLLMNDSKIVSDSLALNVPKITASIAGVADNIEKLTHPHWYDRLLGYALNGAILYRELNPATMVVSGAVAAVTSQK